MRNWKIKKQDEQLVAALRQALGCTHYFARVLINRGFDTPEKAAEFLNTGSSALHDPFLFRDMEAAVARIMAAIRGGERITVYGDYDVDGITATSLLVEALRALGATVDYYIPSRFTEGYGVNSAAVRAIAERGTGLMITVDTGITAVREVEEARGYGLDVIITDHHECQAELPKALIINPKQPGCGYPFAELAGVGVVFKLVTALEQRAGMSGAAERYLSFAAIGTIADVMPMRGENRYIVREGLERLKRNDCIGLKALLARCVGERTVDTAAIGFAVAPRINASGRMGSAALGVDLLTTKSPDHAAELVDRLCMENNRRQETENRILEEAVAMIEKDPQSAVRSAIVLWSEEWHNGVIGIVASRLKERYGKPCILFTVNGAYAKGSGRSIQPFSLFGALEQLQDKLEKFGGHSYAAGLLVRTDRLEEFRDAFCAQVDLFLESGEFDESIEADCVLRAEDLTPDRIRELDLLAPFGRGNETPAFCMQSVYIADAVPTANGNHMRLTLHCGTARVTAFYFNVSPASFCYQPGDRVDLIFEADVNVYNGRRYIQMSVRDMRYAQEQSEQIEKELNRMESGRIDHADVPARCHMAALYRYLQKQAEAGTAVFDFYSLPDHVAQDQRCAMTVGATYHGMKILRELGILEYSRLGSLFCDLRIHAEKRVSLEDSEILKTIRRKAGDAVWV